MRAILFILSFSAFLFGASGHTFLTDKYTKEIDLESKIISNIAKSIIKSDLKVYIPSLKEQEREIFKNRFQLSADCNDSNFIYLRDSKKSLKECDGSKMIYFTNSYRKLMGDERFIGAFFWSKSRPNVIFLQKRLDSYNITLPKSYDKYIENF